MIRPAAAPLLPEAADNEMEGITETVRKWNGRGFLSWLIKNMVWLSGAAVGAAAFLCIYGVRVLDVTYTDWLLGGGDLTQHYLGWCFFRDSAWTFPVGLMDRMSWPYEVSVIFTDSVPLLAVFFKLFRGILPEQFQYFGLWGLMCFLLQGAFASLLIHHYVGKKAEAAVGSLLFILTPVLLSQMTVNMALGAHWLVLLCLWLGILRERLKPVRTAVCWGAAGLLAAGVQLYFIPICGLILLSFFLTDLVKKKEIRRGASAVGAFAACSVGMTALLGGFSHAHLADFTILGQAAFNLNGLFNPQGWSRVIETLPVRGDDAQEGLAFPGVGILLALAAGLIGWLGRIAFRLFVRRENPFPALAAGLRGGQGYPGTGSPYGRKGGKRGRFSPAFRPVCDDRAVFPDFSWFRCPGKLFPPAVGGQAVGNGGKYGTLHLAGGLPGDPGQRGLSGKIHAVSEHGRCAAGGLYGAPGGGWEVAADAAPGAVWHGL